MQGRVWGKSAAHTTGGARAHTHLRHVRHGGQDGHRGRSVPNHFQESASKVGLIQHHDFLGLGAALPSNRAGARAPSGREGDNERGSPRTAPRCSAHSLGDTRDPGGGARLAHARSQCRSPTSARQQPSSFSWSLVPPMRSRPSIPTGCQPQARRGNHASSTVQRGEG